MLYSCTDMAAEGVKGLNHWKQQIEVNGRVLDDLNYCPVFYVFRSASVNCLTA